MTDDVPIVAAVRAHDPATTSDIVEEVGLSRQEAERRLRSLREDGVVSSKQIGASVVWFIPRERAGSTGFDVDELRGDPSTTLADTDAEQDATTTAGMDAGTPAGDGADESGHTRDEHDALVEDVRAYLAMNDDLPQTSHGRNAIIDVFRYLREHGVSNAGEIRKAVYPEYTEEWESAESMWNAIDRHLGSIPGIEASGYDEWMYAGDDAVREVVY